MIERRKASGHAGEEPEVDVDWIEIQVRALDGVDQVPDKERENGCRYRTQATVAQMQMGLEALTNNRENKGQDEDEADDAELDHRLHVPALESSRQRTVTREGISAADGVNPRPEPRKCE